MNREERLDICCRIEEAPVGERLNKAFDEIVKLIAMIDELAAERDRMKASMSKKAGRVKRLKVRVKWLEVVLEIIQQERDAWKAKAQREQALRENETEVIIGTDYPHKAP